MPRNLPAICCALAAFLAASHAFAQEAATQPRAKTDFKFSFAPGNPPEGFIAVSPETAYSPSTDFGFDLGSKPATQGNAITSDRPLFFSVKLPEGNYRVTAALANPTGDSKTTIRTESGHLMAADIAAKPGELTRRSFIANVRRPTLPPPPQNAPGWSQVHMFLRGEAESLSWDEKLTLEFNGPRPSLVSLEISKADDVPTLFTAGDSTVGDPRRGPGGNWPTQLCQFLKPDIALCNSAEGGETTKSFLTGARLDKVLSAMKPGDFLLIQFGHNDSKANWPQTYTDPDTTFKAYLKVYLTEVRRRGGTLVLVTPMERRANQDSVGPWARAMKEFAEQEKIPLIDQWSESKKLWTAMGDNVGAAFSDQTHLSGYGGYLLSKIVANGIKKNVPELARHLLDDLPPVNLAPVDPPPAYLSQSSGQGGGRGAPPATAPRN